MEGLLDYASANYKFVYSYEKQYVQNMECQPQNQNFEILILLKKNCKSYIKYNLILILYIMNTLFF